MKQNVRVIQAQLQATLSEAASSESHLQQSRQELRTEEDRLEKLKKKVKTPRNKGTVHHSTDKFSYRRARVRLEPVRKYVCEARRHRGRPFGFWCTVEGNAFYSRAWCCLTAMGPTVAYRSSFAPNRRRNLRRV